MMIAFALEIADLCNDLVSDLIDIGKNLLRRIADLNRYFVSFAAPQAVFRTAELKQAVCFGDDDIFTEGGIGRKFFAIKMTASFTESIMHLRIIVPIDP